ncbi:MAG: hypothetical protein ACI4N4_04960 [Candidatus Fimenecus sp.]
MKKYLKNKEGMALPMVLIIMTILSLFATGLAMYAHNSYLSVRWMNEEKRAYYLARAGVEAASFSYQNAVSKTSANYNNLAKYADFTAIDKLLTVSENSDEIIKTNKVYLRYSTSGENEGTRWDGLEFKTYSSDSEAIADTSCIGYFEVQVGNGTDKINVGESNGNTTEQDVDVKVFRAKAVCGERSQVAFGYITPSDNVSSMELYDDDGYLFTTGVTKEEAEQNGTNGQFVKTNKTIYFDTDIIDSGDGFFTRLGKGIILWVFQMLYPDGRNIDIFVKTGEGNVILSKPLNSKHIKANPNKDNFYVFATTGNLFLDNVGIESIPTKGYYSSIGLYGDQIVIDGDITMEVYYTNPNSLLGDRLASTLEMIGNRFRLGTVVLGDASALGTDRRDPVPLNKGGLQYNGASVPANKVYFNGNVYVKLYTQGGSTETYRVFNAGDIAYFYGAYTVTGNAGSEPVESRGIDLLKYFIDAVLADKDGFKYGEALKQKLRKVNELYYGGTEASYFTDDNVLVRKIQVDYKANGQVEVDGGYGSVMDIIQTSPTDSTSLTWGRPAGGDVFE